MSFWNKKVELWLLAILLFCMGPTASIASGYENNKTICDSLVDLEWADWPITTAHYKQILADMDRLNKDLIRKSGHCRIGANLIQREESAEQLEAVFAAIKPGETNAALHIHDLLNDKNGYPKFDLSNPNDPDFIGYYDLDTDLITLQRAHTSPTSSVLLHLLGRWGYVNILSAMDRQEFWKSLEKYYGSQRLSKKQLRAMMPWQQASVDGDNLLEGPDEFFAYQFEMWAWQRRMPARFQSGKFWRKYAPEYDHALRYRMMQPKRLESEFNKLFSKIMP